MAGPALKDFEPESFTLEKYVEKLAQLNPDTGLGPLHRNKDKSKPFNPEVLLDSFEESIHVLQELSDKNQRRVDKLEHVCQKQEKEHASRIKDLESMYTEAFSEFHQLEDRISNVVTKVVHLGEQLESTNNRRVRGMEAQSLMHHLTEFQAKAKPSMPVFTDPARKLEAADLIFKLHALSQDLPQTSEYTEVRKRISDKYAEIENQLINEFIDAQMTLDTKRMKMYAHALVPFSYGSQKVQDNYIHHYIPNQQFSSPEDMFVHVERLCKKVHDQTVEVFENPDVIMTKFIQTIIEKVVQKRIDSDLRPLYAAQSDKERYLVMLTELYSRSLKFQSRLSELEVTVDSTYFSKMIRVNLFSKYLSSYAETEIAHQKAHSSHALSEFQDFVGISKKMGSKLAVASPLSGDETYVSQEVCTSVLHECRYGIKRASILLSERELSEVARGLYSIILDKLCTEHFHTALDIALAADPKTAPIGYFCLVVGNVNINMHLIENLFMEIIRPNIHNPTVAAQCMDERRSVMSKLEAKLESGIEKSMGGIVSHVKQLLSSYQKKTDYRPEVPEVVEGTQACNRAVTYINDCCKVLRQSLDGKNLEVVLLELGVRLHQVIYEHIQQYSVNEIGAMIIICDMNEYRRVIKEFKNPFLDELFENLQTLCNIFIVKADNLTQVFSEEPYVKFERHVLQTMIQLRSDYKTAKLQKIFNP